MATFIIFAILVLVVFGILKLMFKNHPGNGINCSGGCGSCPFSGKCHINDK